MDVLRFAGVAVLAACVLTLIRREFPQLALPVSAAAVCVFAVFAAAKYSDLFSAFSSFDTAREYAGPLLRGAAITVIGGLAADICRDVNENALGNAVELVSRAAVLALAFPFLEALITTALRLL